MLQFLQIGQSGHFFLAFVHFFIKIGMNCCEPIILNNSNNVKQHAKSAQFAVGLLLKA